MNIRARLLLISLSLLISACSTSFVVNSSGDESDTNPGDNSCETVNNECTLRAAIQEANANSTNDIITFENVSTIAPNSALPPLTASNTTIDGAGQVTLDGGQVGGCGGFDGINLQSNYNIIQGLTIVNFGTGINVNGFNNTAEGNTIGFNANSSPDGNDRNVIGGNCRGIYIHGQGANSNIVAGNFVGTNSDGATANPNDVAGILITNGAANNIVGSLTSSGQPAVDLTDMVAYWTMDEASGVRADSYGSNDLSDNNSVNSASGLVGNAADLEASNNEFLNHGDNADLSLGADTPFTISAWVKPESVGNFNVILQKQAGGNPDSEYKIHLNVSDQPRVWVADGVSAVSPTWGSALSPGTWYHIVAYHDPDADEVGIIVNDGTPVTSAWSGETQDTSAEFLIGADDGDKNHWDGLIDEVGFWKRVLSPQEISSLYNNGLGLPFGFEGLGRNLISGNDGAGIHLSDGDANHISGNLIGTAWDGTSPLPNVGGGIRLTNDSDNNHIGLNANGEGSGNVVSGNGGDGIHIQSSTNNMIAGNFIGTDFQGTNSLGNDLWGVNLTANANGNVIGTNGDGAFDDLEGNVISANGAAFLRSGVRLDAANNVVAGNLIGTDASGSTILPNNGTGITITGTGNLVGTNGDGVSDNMERNVISGNTTTGVHIFGLGNHVAGNFIGTDATGMLGLGNGGSGIAIGNNSPFNIIGTNGDGMGDSEEGNLISANGFDISGRAGIEIQGYTNTIAGNLIGVDVTGLNALGNAQYGITLNDNAFDNYIGTDGDGVSDAEEGNVISGNGWNGIVLYGSTSNTIAGNLIGTDANGTAAVPNNHAIGLSGAIELLASAANNVIGTNGDGNGDAVEGNVISGNSSRGVLVKHQGSDQNVFAGNYIGVDISGSAALPNAQIGLSISDQANSNRIGTNADGTSDAAEANVISSNGSNGVDILAASSNIVAGNFIGTDASGASPLGNGGHGVRIYGSNDPSQSNWVGGTLERANVIANNGGAGVRLSGASFYADQTLVLYNSIYDNAALGISLAPGSATFNIVTPNDPGDVDSGANDLMNFPELSSALVINNSVSITGAMVDGLPNELFLIQFFSSPECDDVGNGEGQTYLGESVEMTNGSGDASFLVSFAVPVQVGHVVTATATNGDNTSEFSACVPIEAGQQQSGQSSIISITPNQNLNCRYACTSLSEIADTLLEGIEYTPLAWDPETGYFLFEGPSFGETCYAPPRAGDTQFMALSLEGQSIEPDQISETEIELFSCPDFSTPTPTLDPDERYDVTTTPTPLPQCSDGIDNDGDGRTDYVAPGAVGSAGDRECDNAQDNDESR